MSNGRICSVRVQMVCVACQHSVLASHGVPAGLACCARARAIALACASLLAWSLPAVGH